MRRRDVLTALAAGSLYPAIGQAATTPSSYDVTGTSPSLSFTLQTTPDGKVMTEDACRGSVTMLYFGYTFCPDVCPLTLQNVAAALTKAGKAVGDVKFLFLTVDPVRDTIPVLSKYVALFGPAFIGLRGDANALARVARRYRVAYSVDPNADPEKYAVSHSSVIYVFDREGQARLLVPSMAAADANTDALAANLVQVAADKPTWWSWLHRMA
jgi:protein SCO1